MSTWISEPVRALRRGATAALALLALAACESGNGNGRGFLTGFTTPGSEGGTATLSKPGEAEDPIRRVAIAGGAVVIAGPEGYCIDPVTVEGDRDGGFAVLASCRILTGGRDGPEVPPVLITVTVGGQERAPVLPDPETLAGLAEAPIRSGQTRGGLVLAQIAAGGDGAFEGGDPGYWRGAFLQGRRLVALALYVPKGSALAGGAGGDLLAAVAQAIREASPRPAGALTGRGGTPSRG